MERALIRERVTWVEYGDDRAGDHKALDASLLGLAYRI